MGNCVSFQLSCDETVNRIIGCLCGKGYIRNLKKNLKAIDREMKDLRATEAEVKNKVKREESPFQQRRPTVRDWLTRVEDVRTRFNDLDCTSYVQLQKLCLGGLFSKNVCLSYKYGKNVFSLLEEVKILKSEGNFEEVTELTPVTGCKGFIEARESLRDLQREMEDLRAIQDVVENKVAREEAQHRHMLKTVERWLTRAEGIDARFSDLLTQVQNLCLCGLFQGSVQNVCPSYSYAKSISSLLIEAKRLKSEGDGFKEVTEPALRYVVEERPTRSTVGQEEMLEKAWNRLMKDEVRIMGLHGMGGVGKTTLFKKIHNKFTEIDGTFNVVIWIVVSQGANISKLQEDIAQKLQLCGGGWTSKNESDKAVEIHRVLKGKRFVLMLDDLWEKVDLEAIGVPELIRENGCKVTFTTRSADVCNNMGDHEPMQVKCLESDQAWELFKSKVGDHTLREPCIVELAKKVAEKCDGLPLALTVIGETMSSRTAVPEWEDAIYELTRAAAEFPNMEYKILRILKYSYESLVDERTKSCFLYCALFPEDDQIEKKRLIEYWICEGFIGEHKVIRRAINKGYVVLGTLIRANLLTEINTEKVVMHDVVREMALWIASYFGKQKENYVVQARAGLRNIQETEVKDWGAVRRMSLMENQIGEISCGPKCSELTTLLLQNNKCMTNISGEFIGSMQKLLVLDLSFNYWLRGLPEQISELTSLQYLNLSNTDIAQLPDGFQELKKLAHLNLSFTVKLRCLSGISKLSSLRILKLRYSKVHGDVSLVKELQLLEHLQVLTIDVSTELGLEQILGDQRLGNCIDTLGLIMYVPIYLSLLLSMENLRFLYLKNLRVLEIDTNKKGRDSPDLHNPTIPWFTNLSTVVISCCDSIKDLTWLLFAPNLVTLHVSFAEEMQVIVNEEKASNLTGIINKGTATKYSPFQKLKSLTLQSLPSLESIYWSPLPFPFLVYVEISSCPNLRKFPLNATSVPRVEELTMVIEDETKIEWEDEDTKNRFWPLINRWGEV